MPPTPNCRAHSPMSTPLSDLMRSMVKWPATKASMSLPGPCATSGANAETRDRSPVRGLSANLPGGWRAVNFGCGKVRRCCPCPGCRDRRQQMTRSRYIPKSRPRISRLEKKAALTARGHKAASARRQKPPRHRPAAGCVRLARARSHPKGS